MGHATPAPLSSQAPLPLLRVSSLPPDGNPTCGYPRLNGSLPRDRLQWLVAALVAVLAPHALNLVWWLPPLWAGVLGWSWWAARRGRPLPSGGVRLALTLGLAAAVLAHYGSTIGRDAGVALLATMTVLKLTELRGPRDARVVLFVGYFLIGTLFLFTQSIPTALYAIAQVVAVTAALNALHDPAPAPPAARLRLAATLLAQAVPMALLLFFLFPRLPGPLWSLPQDAYSGMTGLDDEMAPGEIGRLSQSGAVAFRVDFAGPVPDPQRAYWRGPVLWHFDGRRWRAGSERPVDALEAQGLGEAVEYTVTLEPHNRRWLFAIDLPGEVPEGAHPTREYQLLADEPVRERRRYPMRSWLDYRIEAAALLRDNRWRGLRLPEGGNERARELAQQWWLEARDEGEVVARALRYFRAEPFVYTLTPPLLGSDPVDRFLFETRRGFCEHYAGAFVFLMRAAGIPARVVTGYQGGEVNPVGGYVIVRQADAHAWAEVWLAGRGWVRVDPTAAVAPERVERGLAAAVAAGEPVPFLARRGVSWIYRLSMQWDAVNNLWNQWVLGYGAETQHDFLRAVAPFLASWEGMAGGLLGGLSAAFAVAAAGLLWPRRRIAEEPAAREYRRFCDRLARLGLPRRPAEGPLDYAERVAAARPELAERVRFISRLYIALRYRERGGAEGVRRLRRVVSGFRG